MFNVNITIEEIILVPCSELGGNNRREILKLREQVTNKFKKEGLKKIQEEEHYIWLDSPIDGPNSLHSTFSKLTNTRSLRKFIEKKMYPNRGIVAIEFGGVGRSLFKGFSQGFIEKSAAITLFDHDLEGSKMPMPHQHLLIEDDLFNPSTYQSINTWLTGRKVDLILERMGRGLELVPPEPYTVSSILRNWYRLLSDNGLMIVQSPMKLNPLFSRWCSMIERNYLDVFDFKYQIGHSDGNFEIGFSCFYLQKKPGAPKELPVLTPKEIQNVLLVL